MDTNKNIHVFFSQESTQESTHLKRRNMIFSSSDWSFFANEWFKLDWYTNVAGWVKETSK